LEEFADAEGLDGALDGGEGKVTEPGEVIIAQSGDQVVGFVSQAEINALFGGREIRHHPGHELRELLFIHHHFLLPQLTHYSAQGKEGPAAPSQ
jgi:hypothetical protein